MTTRPIDRVTSALASLKLAVPVMGVLGVVCAWATFYERDHGTPAAQRVFYQSWWFTALLVLLGVNILFSLLKRFPWNRHQAGFVLAHMGILLILAGSLVTLRAGFDGQLVLAEGETDTRLTTSETDGSALYALPFRVTLLQFRADRYPGSSMASTYESRVRVDDPERGVSEHLVSMNNPLHYRGYIFFQSSFVEGTPMTSVFSVSRSPGLPVVYTGTALLSLGVLWMFYLKPWLARRQGRRAAEARGRREVPAGLPAALAVLAILGSASPRAAADDLQPLRTLAVQDGGRVKPLDTFARETARRVSGASPFTGGESIKHMVPAEWMLSMLADPATWQEEPMIRVTHAELRKAIALPEGRDRFSFRELASHPPFLAEADRVHAKMQQGREARLLPIEQEVSDLYETLGLLSGVFSGEALRVIPADDDTHSTWLSVADVQRVEPAYQARVAGLLRSLVAAEQAGDRVAMGTAASLLAESLGQRSPHAYPHAVTLAREVGYNRAKPFLAAWLAYLLGFLLLLASFPLKSRLTAIVSAAVVVLGFSVHTWGMAMRTLISGRAPVTNMYESIVFVAWGAMLFALVFEGVYRSRWFLAASLPLAVVSLILADNLPILDGAIDPLVPVLRNNMWLTCHVLTITLGYAAFLLAMGLGHLNLGLYFFAPGRPALMKTMSLFLYRAVQVGTLFLAVGTLLGGVWASYSWGRFWGWDPKETWALIALIGYLAVLHGRFLGWFKDFGLAVGSILGFLLVLMAWYGVNYVLGTGLHSYGFGSGGYGWIAGFLGFEALVLVAATVRRRSLRPGTAMVPAGAVTA